MKAKKKITAKIKAKPKPKLKRVKKKAAAIVLGSGCAFCDLNLDPYYAEISKGVGAFVHQTTRGPIKCVNPAKQELPSSKQVWFSKDKVPGKAGVYRTSLTNIAHYGSCYSFWNGDKWMRYKDWGTYHEVFNFVWCGTGPKNLDPFENA